MEILGSEGRTNGGQDRSQIPDKYKKSRINTFENIFENVVVDFLTDSFYPGENSHLIRCGIDDDAYAATKPSCKILQLSKTVGFSKAICFPYF